MRQLLIAVLVTLSINLYAQQDKGPIVQVVGNSRLSVKPDVGVLIIGISNKSLNVSQATTGLNDKTKNISRQLTGIGFKESDIKTTDFQVRENKIYRREEYVDSGYVATQNVRVEFKYDKETIVKILNAFSKSKTDFTLNIDFKLSDQLRSSVQNELLKLAIQDSREKSKLISETSGVKLKKIKEINYYGAGNAGGGREEYTPMYKSMAPGMANDTGFTPNEMLFTDSIVVIWEIESL